MIDLAAQKERVDPIETAVGQLLTIGRQRRYVTWEEMNKILPDDAVDPDRLELIMLRLEEAGIETLDEIDAAQRKKGDGSEAPAKARRADQSDDHVMPADDAGKRIDDPVRMYLTQMGEIPLLTRDEEIRLAKKIELTRMAFRRKVLESDYCARQAIQILEGVRDGSLPFDRTMKISTSEHMAKAIITARMPVNLATATKLLDRNDEAWPLLLSRRLPAAERQSMAAEMKLRRRKIAKLLEELSLRTSRITPLMKKLMAVRRKMRQLERRLELDAERPVLRPTKSTA